METKSKKLKWGMRVFINPDIYDEGLEDAKGQIVEVKRGKLLGTISYRVKLDRPVTGLPIDPFFSENELTPIPKKRNLKYIGKREA